MTLAKNEFNFIEINAIDTIPHDVLHQLMREEITGVLIKNFLSKEEVQLVQNNIKSIPKSLKFVINEGFQTYPISFAQFTQMAKAGAMTIEQYLKIAKMSLENETSHLGLNISNRLVRFLTKHELFEEVSPIIEPKSNQPLIPFNIRELFSGNGELIAHCENLFFNEFPEFFDWLKLMDIKENKLSYFLTLQKSEKGGELCCYDFNWSNVKTRVSYTELKDINGKIINVDDEQLKRFLINPDEGDLLIFAGGNVWHKVLKVLGKKSRITYGGFIAETNKKGKYYVWS